MEIDSDRSLDPVRDPKPELYMIDGSVPPEVLEEYGAWLRRNPAHPGWHLAGTLERKSLSVAEAAELFGVESADLAEVIEGRAPVTPELAVRMEAVGGMPAVVWMRMQISYDLVQARRRLVQSGGIAPDAVDPDPQHQPDLDPERYPMLDPEHGLDPAAALAG